MAGNCRHTGGAYDSSNIRLHTYWQSEEYLIDGGDNEYIKTIDHQPILYDIYIMVI